MPNWTDVWAATNCPPTKGDDATAAGGVTGPACASVPSSAPPPLGDIPAAVIFTRVFGTTTAIRAPAAMDLPGPTVSTTVDVVASQAADANEAPESPDTATEGGGVAPDTGVNPGSLRDTVSPAPRCAAKVKFSRTATGTATERGEKSTHEFVKRPTRPTMASGAGGTTGPWLPSLPIAKPSTPDMMPSSGTRSAADSAVPTWTIRYAGSSRPRVRRSVLDESIHAALEMYDAPLPVKVTPTASPALAALASALCALTPGITTVTFSPAAIALSSENPRVALVLAPATAGDMNT